MGDSGDGSDGTAENESELRIDEADLGEAAAADQSTLLSLLGHFYRGQLDRETTWRSRLDQTTNWAVVVIATILTWTFTEPDNPHYILLLAMGLVTIFLGVEARRYRAYDVWRSRVRMLEEELFAQLFDPDRELEHDDWRQMMSDDLRAPATKIGVGSAVARRLRRVYLPLLSVLLAAWVVKITVFQPGPEGIEAGAIPPIPGGVVIAAVAAFYVGAVAVAFWPRPEEVPPEVDDEEVGAWRRD